VLIECDFEPPHAHEYPDDWIFGGANGLHPGADPRYRATIYWYYDDKLDVIEVNSSLLCDDEAIDFFTNVAALGPDFNPVYVSAKRPVGDDLKEFKTEMLHWKYDKLTDTATEWNAQES
jgi:hypothetical protein